MLDVKGVVCVTTEKGGNNLTFLELENERLQRQLLLLQEQKFISTNRRKDNREGRGPAVRQSKPLTSLQISRQSIDKWVQTNPVPSDEIDDVAVGHTEYDEHRKDARQDLDERWGGEDRGRAPPAPRPDMGEGAGDGNAKGKGKDKKGKGGKANNAPAQTQTNRMTGRQENMQAYQQPPPQQYQQPPPHSQNRSHPPQDTFESLGPERLYTIEEAASFIEVYDPDRPLDVDPAAASPRRNKPPVFPYKPGTSSQPPGTSRSVVVRSERPYSYCDFYGRPTDGKGRPVKDEDELARSLLSSKLHQYPDYQMYAAGNKMVLYQHLLQNSYRRSDDLLRQYNNKRRRYNQERKRRADENEYSQSDDANSERLFRILAVKMPPNTSSAEAQTDRRDMNQNSQHPQHPSGTNSAPHPQQQSSVAGGQRPPADTQKPGTRNAAPNHNAAQAGPSTRK